MEHQFADPRVSVDENLYYLSTSDINVVMVLAGFSSRNARSWSPTKIAPVQKGVEFGKIFAFFKKP